MLKPGGRLIVSVDHPFVTTLAHREAGHEPDYFATYNWVDEWTVDGQTALLSFWARPLHAMTDAFTAAGFRIAVISEPAAAPDTPRELLPDRFADRRRFLCFLFRPAGRRTAGRRLLRGIRAMGLDRDPAADPDRVAGDIAGDARAEVQVGEPR